MITAFKAVVRLLPIKIICNIIKEFLVLLLITEQNIILRGVLKPGAVLIPHNCSPGQQGGGSNQLSPVGPGTDRL